MKIGLKCGQDALGCSLGVDLLLLFAPVEHEVLGVAFGQLDEAFFVATQGHVLVNAIKQAGQRKVGENHGAGRLQLGVPITEF